PASPIRWSAWSARFACGTCEPGKRFPEGRLPTTGTSSVLPCRRTDGGWRSVRSQTPPDYGRFTLPHTTADHPRRVPVRTLPRNGINLYPPPVVWVVSPTSPIEPEAAHALLTHRLRSSLLRIWLVFRRRPAQAVKNPGRTRSGSVQPQLPRT